MNSQGLYRGVWDRLFPSKWLLGLFLILLFGLPRVIIVLRANITGQYQWVSIIFTLMCFTPLIFMTKSGRRAIGFGKTEKRSWLLRGFLLGMGVCFAIFAVFRLTYGLDVSNVFVYIAKSTRPENFNSIFFLIYTAVSMTFSPIGEELFYRGIVHHSFVGRLGERGAAVVDSAAFALTHLAHFGIIYVAGEWEILPVSAILWVLSMFATCIVFNIVKRKSGSIKGAVLTHAGFNFAMSYIIFYCL